MLTHGLIYVALVIAALLLIAGVAKAAHRGFSSNFMRQLGKSLFGSGLVLTVLIDVVLIAIVVHYWHKRHRLSSRSTTVS